MQQWIWIGLAGACGSLGRHAVGTLAGRYVGTGFPWGTLAVNVLGAALLGLVTGVAASGDLLPESVRVPVATGFLGAFTTFSTFSVDTLKLAERGEYGLAVANVVVNLALGFTAAYAGLALGRGGAG